MAYGLEAREPFLDYNILDYLGKLPIELRYKGEPKYWLKKILSKYLPKDLWNRPKTGFQAPIFEIFKNYWMELSEKYLSEEFVKKQGIFDYNYIKQLKDKWELGGYVNPDKLWILVAFQMWYEKWLKK
jgi:asparagine synthase (glutamine-hydrolysing)